ncbi:MAG: hypothetical protein E6J00_10345 [Chloroflexi bacterium]|nr:MAG: hypothetical protein E6J00_10345 [Chloroflexota bacterium]
MAAATAIGICLRAMPSDWSAALARNTVQLATTSFSPEAVDPAHDFAFGYFESPSQHGVASLDLHSGRVRHLSVMTDAEWVAWMSFSDPWLAWEQGESRYVMGNWSIQLLNTRTGSQRQLATSRLPDGTFLTGQLSFPVVGNGYVAWSQPTSHSSADLRLYRFDSGESLAVDSGKVSSPVIAARQLVWGKLGEHDSQPSLRMADAMTAKPATVPAALARPMPIGYLSGSPGYLVWTTGTELMVEQPDSGALSRYHFTRDAIKHPFQFPMLAGHFLVWYTGTSNTILDLQTGNAFDVPLPSSVAASGDEIVVTRPVPGAKGAVTNTTVSWIRTSPATRLASCSH